MFSVSAQLMLAFSHILHADNSCRVYRYPNVRTGPYSQPLPLVLPCIVHCHLREAAPFLASQKAPWLARGHVSQAPDSSYLSPPRPPPPQLLLPHLLHAHATASRGSRPAPD